MTDLTTAKARVIASRARLNSTAKRLQHRMRPAALVVDALNAAQLGGRTVAIAAAQTPRRRPTLAVAMIVGGISYFFRKPILTFVARQLAKEPHHE